jgi:hypothetical protein
MTKQVPLNAVLELTAKFGGILQDLAAIVGENTASGVSLSAAEAKAEETVSEGASFIKNVREKLSGSSNPVADKASARENLSSDSASTAEKATRGRKRKSVLEAGTDAPIVAAQLVVQEKPAAAPIVVEEKPVAAPATSDEDFFGEAKADTSEKLTLDSFKEKITDLINQGRKFDAQFANKNIPVLLGVFFPGRSVKLTEIFDTGRGQEFLDALAKTVQEQKAAA